MQSVAVICEKGGVGKTTLCAYLTWHFTGAGKRVLAIDLDQQANLTHTLGDHQDATAASLFVPETKITPAGNMTVVGSDPDILEIEQSRDESIPLAFRDNVLRAGEYFDLCIIDTPPSLGMRAVAALITAGFTIAPIDLGDYSILGIQRVLDFQARVAEHFNIPPPEFLGILPSRYDRKSPRERAIYDQLVGEGDRIPLFPCYVTKRDAYARSASERIPAWQMQGTAAREAAAEMRAIMAEFDKRLGGSGAG
jgi:chromosome partitioning protein